jgi:diguanylate cyclase (GGDEF)-like protein
LLRRLHALDISEERPLAGQVAGALYLTGAVTAPTILLAPGVETRHWAVIFCLAAIGLVWGTICLTLVPWDRIPPAVSLLSSGMGLPITAVGMAATGGAQSPARFYLLFIVFYCAYFYRPREAFPFLFACIGVLLLPIAYDSDAVSGGLIGELVIIAPTYLVLGMATMAGKRLLVSLHEAARDLSLSDPLTELANRRALIDALERHVGGARATDAVGLMLIDLDGFKDANTLYGHPAGDAVLRSAAAALRAATRGDDLVARLGGDEFAIVVRPAREWAMRRLADRVLAQVRRTGEGTDLPGFELSASVGWALYPHNATSVDDLIAAADLALRGAKALGKDCAQCPLDWVPAGLDSAEAQ